MRRAIPAAVAAAAVLAGGAAVSADGPPRVVAQDRDGDTMAELALPRSGTFALTYRHSYYRRPAVERFAAADDGSFRLVEIASPSEAVLEYYDVEGARTRHDGWWTLKLARPARFDADGARRHRRGPPHARGRRPPRAAVPARRACRAPDDRRRGELTWRPRQRTGRAASPPPSGSANPELGRGELEPHTEEHLLDEFEGERPGRKLHGAPATILSLLGAGLSLYAIYWVFQPMSAQQYRPVFLSVSLLMTFMVFRGGRRRDRADHPEENPTAGDWALGLLAAAVGRLRGRDRRRAVPPRRRARRRSTSSRASSRCC